VARLRDTFDRTAGQSDFEIISASRSARVLGTDKQMFGRQSQDAPGDLR